VSVRTGIVLRPDFRPDTLQETAAAERARIAELWCGRTASCRAASPRPQSH